MDDDFSDDGFDDLNDSVLQQIEYNALQFTQAAKQVQSQAAAPLRYQPPQQQHQQAPQQTHHQQAETYDYEFDDDDLDDTVVIDAAQDQQPARPVAAIQGKTNLAPYRPVTVAGNQQRPPTQQFYRQPSQFAVPSRPVPPSTAHRPLAPYGAPRQAPPQPSQFVRPPPPGPRPFPQQSQALHAATGPGRQNEILAALQTRLHELEAELTTARGEILVVRSKYDKAVATHDAEMARLKKQTAEQLAKQERMLEAAKAAERQVTTELQFAHQDLREGLGRARPKKKDGAATPKKSKTRGMGDGFDDVEMVASPSKTQAQKRRDAGAPSLSFGERTPSKGKRKRPAVDSPTFALETHSGDEDQVSRNLSPKATPSAPISRAPDTLSYDFLRLALDHVAIRGQPPTFDLFAGFHFPSDPSQSFAAIIFHKLPQMGSPLEPARLLSDFCELIIDMWQRCLSERYHTPIFYLAALVSHTLELGAITVAPHIAASLVPMCATTCRLVALPRLHSSGTGEGADQQNPVVRQLRRDIDVTQCLSLLYLTALGCLPQPPGEPDASLPTQQPPQAQFWRTMELDFVLTMLSPKIPEPEWLGMLAILRTSVLPESIGPIPAVDPVGPVMAGSGGRAIQTSSKPAAEHVIDCVSSFLCDLPLWAAPGSHKEHVARSAALRTLMAFSTSPAGAFYIAQSDVALPRLVTMLCWAIDSLYDVEDLPPLRVRRDDVDVDDAQPLDGEHHTATGVIDQCDVRSELYQMISQAMTLLHGLVTDPGTADMVNTTAKLAASNGGAQRYLLALARIYFAEDNLLLEAGMDAETVELASELLDLYVNPEEAQEIQRVFGGNLP